MEMNRTIILIIFALMPAFLLSQNQEQPRQLRKCALIIGNSNYPSSILTNPENDARAVAAILQEIGFKVYQYENVKKKQMKKVIEDFALSLKGCDVGLFFYTGHGIQAFGNNYLIPVDANLLTERQVKDDCLEVNGVLALMEGSGTRANIIILDACRDNPFERLWTGSSTGRGLASMSAPAGTLIAFSTAPGKIAQDDSGNNSPYTAAFLEILKVPDLSVSQIFLNLTALVVQRTGRKQIPWISMALTEDLYLNPSDKSASISPNQVISKPTVEKQNVEQETTPVTRQEQQYANQPEKEASREEGSSGVEEMPRFMGKGMEGFMEWTQKNLRYPSEAAEYGIQGRVYVQFTVNPNGEVVDAKVIKGVHPALDTEALRLVMSSPKWTPGKKDGKPVKMQITFPVVFALQ